MTESFSLTDWQSGKRPPDGWDAADAVANGWSKADLETFMRGAVRAWIAPVKPDAAVRSQMPHDAPPVASPAPVSSGPVREARTTQQEKPEPATVTHIQTRKTVAADDGWQLGLVCNAEGKVKPGATKNWALFLEHHPDMHGVLAWDAFKLRVMLLQPPPWSRSAREWKPRTLQDRDYSEAVMWLESLHMTPKASNIAAVMQTVAEHNSYDRLRDYLEGLKWDGKPRVERWLTYYLGAENCEYSRAVGMRWLVSSVARGLLPGCKVDTMPILEGPQGARKSTLLRKLYGDEFFTDELSDIGSKDAIMELQGVWCLEVAEMHRFSASETNAVKKFISRQADRFRPPYGRSVIEAPRRVCITGTINPEGNAYLKDPTGARRFWPISVGSLDIDGIVADRDQLWAEAVRLYKSGVPWWVQEDEQAAVVIEQEKRTETDVWADIIGPFIHSRTSVTQLEIFKELGIPTKEIDGRPAARVGRIMKKLGWQATRERAGGEDRTVYLPTKRADAEPASGGEDW